MSTSVLRPEEVKDGPEFWQASLEMILMVEFVDIGPVEIATHDLTPSDRYRNSSTDHTRYPRRHVLLSKAMGGYSSHAPQPKHRTLVRC